MKVHQLEILAPPERAAMDLEDVNVRLSEAPVDETLGWAHETFGSKLVLATGFGPSGVVLLDHVARLRLDIRTFFLDTGLLFPSTYTLRDALSERFDVSIEAIEGISLARQTLEHGDRLWSRDPDQCCRIRKVDPLHTFLSDKDAWITGLRRDQSSDRARTKIIEWDVLNGLYKLNPLAGWTSERIWAHIRRYDLPYNELHDEGYPSIGCEPCTRRVRTGEDERAGRWAGTTKTECGIHRRREVA